MKTASLLLTTTLLFCLASTSPAQEIGIDKEVDVNGWPKPIPVAISGFSGEADSVLKFDLFFMGFANTTPDKARFLIQGSNNGRVEARVTDTVAQKQIIAKAFTGGTTRSQTHALADEICLAATGKPGIAQSKIAFKAQRTGYGAGEVYIADYDGHNAQAVTADNVIIAQPSWGGRALLFYMSHKLADEPKIFSHNLTTGARKTITRYPGSNISPAVSPDGTKVAMILSKSGSPELYVSDPDGNNLRQLTTTKEGGSSPCWSPDSRQICFVSRESGKAALYLIPAEGGAMKRLPTAGIANPTEPDWSPDGRFIIFTAQMGGFQICLVPVEGSNRGQATVLTAGEDPAWAPNSRAVIFSRNKNNRHVLSLLDVPTKQVKDATPVPGSASQPSWAR